MVFLDKSWRGANPVGTAYLIFSRRQRGMCELMDVMLTRRRVFPFAGV